MSINEQLSIDPSNHNHKINKNFINFQDSSPKITPNTENKILQHYPSPTKTSTFLKELLPHPRQVLSTHAHTHTHARARSVFINPTQHFDPDLPTATSSLRKERKGDRILLIADSIVSKRAIKQPTALVARQSYVLLPAFPAALLEPRPSPRFFHARQRERDTLLVAAAPVWFHHPSPFPRPRALHLATPSFAVRGQLAIRRTRRDRSLSLSPTDTSPPSSTLLYTPSFRAPRSPLSLGARILSLVEARPRRRSCSFPLLSRVFAHTEGGLPSRVTCYPDTMGSRTQTCKMARPTVATQTPSSLAAAVETGLHARFDVSRIAVIRCCGYRVHAGDSTTRLTYTRYGIRFASVCVIIVA